MESYTNDPDPHGAFVRGSFCLERASFEGESLCPMERWGSEEADKEPGLLTEVGRKVCGSSPDRHQHIQFPPSLCITCR